jgi:branched-chain amino acid transport system ATP-binding protein
VLEVEGLSVRYGRVTALEGVSLTVDAGEMVAVVGPNGAGKSSLLSAIVGRTKAAAGSVRFAGQELIGMPMERIVRLGLGLVPEGRHIFETLSVAENLKLGAMARASGDAAATGDDERWVTERFPVLERYMNSPAGRLSGGEQQQLAIARAMLARPKLLLLDEPSLGLAPLLVDEVFRILRQLHEEGTQILLVEQNATRAVAMADRGYVMKSGRVAMQGTREALQRSSASMTSAYLGDR